MRILGADLSSVRAGRREGRNTLALLDARGRVAATRRPQNLPELATDVADLAEGEPFLLAVNVAVVGPRGTRSRPVDNLVRRRMGLRLAAARPAPGSTERPDRTGEALVAALAAAGHPCLAFPDRDRRRSGLAEIHAPLVLKALLWESSTAARSAGRPSREEVFRAFSSPVYRAGRGRGKATWADRAVAIDVILRCLRETEGYDLGPVSEAISSAASEDDVERAAGVLETVLLAGTAHRYIESPETCVFLGDADKGYTILPADGFVRSLAIREKRPRRGGLFPRTSLGEYLGDAASLRSSDLLSVPGKPERLEAVFSKHPRYEFDNLDEMLWWKHCRHLSGPVLLTEGLQDMVVKLGTGEDGRDEARSALRLVRSRHRTLSFRFDPPAAWRVHLPTRDGKTYPFRVLRATYETLPSGG